MKTLILNVSRSSHPDFIYFAEVRNNGRQVARRGNTRLEIAEFIQKLRDLAKARGDVTIVVNDTTLEHEFEEYV